MKARRMLSGIGLLCGSAMLGKAFTYLSGIDDLLGISVASFIAFVGGALFMTGFYSGRSSKL